MRYATYSLSLLSLFLLSLFLQLFLNVSVLCAEIETFYGKIEVEEPVLLELIESPAFQRLKGVRQYGVTYYLGYADAYTRYDHSLGVFAVLRNQGCSLKEQIAGLLHDISHTVFSHVGDRIFPDHPFEEDYQTTIHATFLERYKVGEILERHGFSIPEILPKQHLFPALEQQIPELCADRIDYNIQGAYHRGWISYEEAISLFKDLRWADGEWSVTEEALWSKIVRYDLFMSQNCWGGPLNELASCWLARAILRGIEIGSLDWEEVHFGTDDKVWDKLLRSLDPTVQKEMQKVCHAAKLYVCTDQDANLRVSSKLRVVDPWVRIEGEKIRLTRRNVELADEVEQVRARIEEGFLIHVFETDGDFLPKKERGSLQEYHEVHGLSPAAQTVP